jgi:hypothetical protein
MKTSSVFFKYFFVAIISLIATLCITSLFALVIVILFNVGFYEVTRSVPFVILFVLTLITFLCFVAESTD